MTDLIAFHLLRTLIRKGVLDLDDVEAMAADIVREDGDDDTAHSVRGAYFEAHGRSEADLARDEMKVVQMVPRVKLGPQADGGNDSNP